jgi:DNA modification methylase
MLNNKNKLNELNNTEWIIETKSVWVSQNPKRNKIKAQHPATFCEPDIVRLIKFFTKKGEKVLDPFVGSGTTLVACEESGRIGTGIELIDKWVEVSELRLEMINKDHMHKIIHGNSSEEVSKLEPESFDFIVTSPPYWKILQKDTDHKARIERKEKGLGTKYSDDDSDLGNVEDYRDFLYILEQIFADCFRVLKNKKYMCVVVSDFRHKSDFIAYHNDISKIIECSGFKLEGITILVQNDKALYPYGMPYAFVSNIHHQYILVFRKK